MTTVTIQGLRVDYSFDSVASVGSAEAAVTVPSGTSTFSYQVTGTNADGMPTIDITDDASQILLDGMSLADITPSSIDAQMLTVSWPGGTTTVLALDIWTSANSDTSLIFVLDGTPLPDITSISDWESLDASITGVSVPTGNYAPGANIPWSDFDNSTATEDDTLLGTAGKDNLFGGIGDDYFVNSHGNDSYHGGDGYDQVSFNNDPGGVTASLATGTATDGWGNTDKLVSIEMLRGSAYADALTGDGGRNIIRGLAGNDTLDGGAGRDEVRYDRDSHYGGTDGVTVNLKTGSAIDGFGDSDTLTGFRDVRGTDYNDDLTGSNAVNKVQAGAGADTIHGLGGNDQLLGENGNDRVFGGAGADMLLGGRGNDKLDGGGGNDTIGGEAGNDKLFGKAGADRLDGAAGNDQIHGGRGNDRLLGDNGADKLFGEAGNDTIYGGAGADTLNGGAGNDKLYGGAQADRFDFVGNFGDDTIFGFHTGGTHEKISLAGVAAITSFKDLVNHHLGDVAGDAVIDDGHGNTITLHGVAAADLMANDFLF